MIKSKLLSSNDIYFINYFIIKKDRETLPISLLRGTRTERILISKENPKKFLKEITTWFKKELSDQELILIPFPSTNKLKPKQKQLPYLLTKELHKINPKWIDGNGLIARKISLPKNTRNIKLQLESLKCVKPNMLKGKDVLIIDDVVTSGSSLKAAINLIKAYHPRQVKGFALARKVYLKDIPLTGLY